ncbi:MAG TPA: N,N-dimethylformamidase beta subunit family domain-containing protein [Gaiellaceae bacterium]|nr:N,N-dimethylformamidase beta subunit family domain-containing protein [Gaiellaceae bacterium]
MRRPPVLALLAALAVVGALGAPSGRAASSRPLLVGAAPAHEPSDTVGDGFRRVTFSPDGDGRDDAVTLRVRAPQGDPLTLRVNPISRGAFTVAGPNAGAGVTTLRWDGLEPNGKRYPDDSYAIAVCDTKTRACTQDRVLAHLRVITTYVEKLATGVDPGATLRVNISSDLVGPFSLDLVAVGDPDVAVGSATAARPGWTSFTVPSVPHGGLWLLRVRDGSAVDHFPIVVHQPSLALDDPPAHTALVVYPWLTWRAYDIFDQNRDGIPDSWYSHPSNPVDPLYGPFEIAPKTAAAEGREPNPLSQDAFAQWLAEHKLVAQHVTDVELASLPAGVIAKYATVVFEGHTEYYLHAEYEKMLAYRNAGGRLYFFQGNPFYGQAQIVGDQVWRRSYRYRTPQQSDFGLTGVGFRACCWPASIVPVYHLAAGAVERLPWAFTGTGLHDGDPFGVAAGEVDTTDAKLSPAGTFALARATVPKYEPTSEKETLGYIGSKPIPYEPSWVKPRRIVIAYTKAGSGEVFAWANTGFLKTVRFGGYGMTAHERAQLDRVAFNVWEWFVR